MARRILISLLATLAAAGVGRAQSYHLTEAPLPGSYFRCELGLKLTGEIKVRQDDKDKTLKQTAAAQHDFFERVLDVGSHGLVDRAARYYHKAETAISVADDKSERKLRSERALMVAHRLPQQILTYCPKGALTRDEIELTEHFDTLALPGLLPAKEVAVGATWKLTNAAAQALCDLDGLISHDLAGKLDKVEGDVAHLTIAGSAGGIDLGAAVKITVRATATFDLKAKRLTALEWNQQDEREQGPVNPALKADVAITVKRTAVAAAQQLNDLALIPMPEKFEQKIPENLTHVTYADASKRFDLIHAREWQTVAQTEDHLVLRLMERGDLIAQATVAPWKKADPGKHMDPVDFKATMERTPGWEAQRIVQKEEIALEHKGYWGYRLVASGQFDGVETIMYFYLVAGPQGDQTVLTFSVPPNQAQKLDARDLAFVRGLIYPVQDK